MYRRMVLVLALVLILSIGAILYFRPFRMTTLWVSNIMLEPEGATEDSVTHELKGTYWVIGLTTDMNEAVGAYTFPKNTTGTVDGKNVYTTSSIRIEIDPEQPYWERAVERKVYQVYPKTYQGWASKASLGSYYGKTGTYIDGMNVVVYQWAEGFWTPHTPFVVKVYKNDALIGEQRIDTVGGKEVIRITNPNDKSEWLTISNLGKFIGYSPPVELDTVCFFENLEYAYSEDVINRILKYDQTDESFSVYWFGWKTDDKGHWTRWKDDGSPSGMCFDHSLAGFDYVYGLVTAPGWKDISDFINWANQPIKADKFKDVVPYIEKYYQRKKVDVWNLGAQLTSDGKVRVNVPYGAMSSLITIMISTELADTIVWHPAIANLKISSVSDIGEVGDRKTFIVKVKQAGTVKSTGEVSFTIEPNNAPATVTPNKLNPTLAPDEELTITAELINLGANQRIEGDVVIACKELLTGGITDQKKAHFSLLPKSVGATSLTVYTIDKSTGERISGIATSIRFDSKSDMKYTVAGVASWDLEGYQGTVYISTAETLVYKSATASKAISVGANVVTILLEKQGEVTPWWVTYWWVILTAIVVCAILIVSFIKKRR